MDFYSQYSLVELAGSCDAWPNIFEDPSYWINPWIDHGADTSPDMQNEELNTNSSSSLPRASNEENTGAYAAKENKSIGQEADQDACPMTGDEARQLAKDKAEEQDFDPDIEVEKAASFVQDQELHIVCGQSAQEDQVASIEKSDAGPAVQNDGMILQHDPATTETSEQRVIESKSCAQKDDILRLDVEMSWIKATDSKTAEQDHGAAVLKETNDDRTAVEDGEACQDQDGEDERTNYARERPERSNSETDDNFLHTRGEVQTEHGIDENAVGSKSMITIKP
jgi:hypothetical protein